MKSFLQQVLMVAAAVVALTSPATAVAEVPEVAISVQPGLLYLPLVVMEQNQLLEKELRKAGLAETKVKFVRLSGSMALHDALLSGNLTFAAGGIPPFMAIMQKTKGTLDVKAVAALSSMPIYLNTRNPNVKTVRDLTDKNKIAMPAVKGSIQAIMLQMVAEEMYGKGNHSRFDSLTVAMSHPDAMAALLSGQGEIDLHFAAPPFNYQELQYPGIRMILNSYDILGKGTSQVVWCTGKFRKENPKTFKAFLEAYQQAMDLIKKDKPAAVEAYVSSTKKREQAAETLRIISDPQVDYSPAPHNMMKLVGFMHRVGTVKEMPKDWKEMFFPEIHHLPGS